jgi:hypothetical protein
MPTTRRPKVKPFEACLIDPAGNVRVVSNHTTSRAALNRLSFRAFFGPAGWGYRVRDSRTGEYVAELCR